MYMHQSNIKLVIRDLVRDLSEGRAKPINRLSALRTTMGRKGFAPNTSQIAGNGLFQANLPHINRENTSNIVEISIKSTKNMLKGASHFAPLATRLLVMYSEGVERNNIQATQIHLVTLAYFTKLFFILITMLFIMY